MANDPMIERLVEGLSSEHAATVRAAVNESFATENREKAIDRDLFADKFYAFRWGDLLRLADLLDAFKMASGGEASAILLQRLLSIWSRLRSIRVELSSDQASVLLAVKKGHRQIPDIAKALTLSEDEVKVHVSQLCGLKYLKDTPILRYEAGQYVTDF